MTPKEKAIELVDNFYQISGDSVYDGITKGMAKRCALITIEEILSELAYTQNYVEDTMNKIQVYISYWQEVKQEIENL